MDFKSFLKKVVDTVEREVDNVCDSINSRQQTTSSQPVPKPQQPQQPQQAPERERTDMEWTAYFREILTKEFPQYAVQENIPVQQLAGDANDEFQLYKSRPRQAYKAEWGKPYTFVLNQDGLAKGIVMLGKGHSHDSNVKYLIARMYAKKMNIPYINFYTQMPNEHDYVVSRIKKFMN